MGEESAFESESPQVVGHLVGCVLCYAHAQQVRLVAQIVVAETVNQMVEQSERQRQKRLFLGCRIFAEFGH
jgi:hypothetical protein